MIVMVDAIALKRQSNKVVGRWVDEKHLYKQNLQGKFLKIDIWKLTSSAEDSSSSNLLIRDFISLVTTRAFWLR